MSIHDRFDAAFSNTSRYFFNLVKGGERIIDDEGVDLHPEELRPEVVLRELAELRESEDPGMIAEWEGWSIEITDLAGRVIQTIVI
jgi:hypothetical protein